MKNSLTEIPLPKLQIFIYEFFLKMIDWDLGWKNNVNAQRDLTLNIQYETMKIEEIDSKVIEELATWKIRKMILTKSLTI